MVRQQANLLSYTKRTKVVSHMNARRQEEVLTLGDTVVAHNPHKTKKWDIVFSRKPILWWNL
jgi:hypothetical protein